MTLVGLKKYNNSIELVFDLFITNFKHIYTILLLLKMLMSSKLTFPVKKVHVAEF
jgi:hypothetical protein